MRYPKPSDFQPEIHFPSDWPVKRKAGTPRCRSWNPNKGRQCKSSPVELSIRCDSHGGKTPSGLASPHTKTGIYSKSLPVRLGIEYKALLELGVNLFRIDDETAMITSLIQEQLSRVEEGESGAAWHRLKEIYDEMAVIGGNPNKTDSDIREFNALFTQIGRTVNYGNMQWAARAEAARLTDLKRKLVNDERRDQAAKHQAMSFDRVMLLLAAVVHGFKTALDEHVADDKARKAVLTDAQGTLNKVVRQ